MNDKTVLIELLLAGFFAVCCLRAHKPLAPGENRTFSDLFRLTGRMERLRRSRWQWFALVAFMLVLRLQQQLPPIIELMVLLEFVLFLALPASATATARAQQR
jgi:hypothetical protein